MTNCHVLCFSETLMPLIVIVCQPIGNAGFFKSGMENTLMCVQVFKRGGTLNDSEKEMQIETLFRKGMSIIYPANLKAPLPNGSKMCVLVPDHLVRKVLIKGIVD